MTAGEFAELVNLREQIETLTKRAEYLSGNNNTSPEENQAYAERRSLLAKKNSNFADSAKTICSYLFAALDNCEVAEFFHNLAEINSKNGQQEKCTEFKRKALDHQVVAAKHSEDAFYLLANK